MMLFLEITGGNTHEDSSCPCIAADNHWPHRQTGVDTILPHVPYVLGDPFEVCRWVVQFNNQYGRQRTDHRHSPITERERSIEVRCHVMAHVERRMVVGYLTHN
jgi:hypothetical protein